MVGCGKALLGECYYRKVESGTWYIYDMRGYTIPRYAERYCGQGDTTRETDASVLRLCSECAKLWGVVW